MKELLYLGILIIVLLVICYFVKETFYVEKPWGYRNGENTRCNLLWQESQPALLMPNPYPYQELNYFSELDTEPVAKAASCANRPPNPDLSAIQVPVASAPFASW